MSTVLIPQTDGTIISSSSPATTRPGAAFDGVYPQNNDNSTVWATATGTAWIGKDWGTGVTHRVTQAKLYATSDADFYAQGSSTEVTISIDESDNGSDWTTIGSYTAPSNTFSNNQILTINCSGGTLKRYHRATFGSNGQNWRRVAEVEFYESVESVAGVFNMPMLGM